MSRGQAGQACHGAPCWTVAPPQHPVRPPGHARGCMPALESLRGRVSGVVATRGVPGLGHQSARCCRSAASGGGCLHLLAPAAHLPPPRAPLLRDMHEDLCLCSANAVPATSSGLCAHLCHDPIASRPVHLFPLLQFNPFLFFGPTLLSMHTRHHRAACACACLAPAPFPPSPPLQSLPRRLQDLLTTPTAWA